uniref:cell cycle regulator of non-homologous end joining isoform X4 n=1 Tax=Panthera onca TaxID=9690 RepID=UPI002954BF45|nr:cell cycle regulator of non-homologous end joining isoform X4 [Panthera onca]
MSVCLTAGLCLRLAVSRARVVMGTVGYHHCLNFDSNQVHWASSALRPDRQTSAPVRASLGGAGLLSEWTAKWKGEKREMETFKSGDKKRVLPTWMTAQVAEKRKVPVKTPKARTSAVMPRVAATRLPATRTVYCMSEAEMVDVALGILIEVKSTVSLLILTTRNRTGPLVNGNKGDALHSQSALGSPVICHPPSSSCPLSSASRAPLGLSPRAVSLNVWGWTPGEGVVVGGRAAVSG